MNQREVERAFDREFSRLECSDWLSVSVSGEVATVYQGVNESGRYNAAELLEALRVAEPVERPDGSFSGLDGAWQAVAVLPEV